jgi:hypothetical protein
MPDCPASGQSGTGMKEFNDDGTGPLLICICKYTVYNARMPNGPASGQYGTGTERKKRSAKGKHERESTSVKKPGAKERERKSAKCKAQKRAQTRRRERLRPRARRPKKSACPALVFFRFSPSLLQICHLESNLFPMQTGEHSFFELWKAGIRRKCVVLDEDTVEEHLHHQPGAAEAGDPEAVGTEYGQFPIFVDPGEALAVGFLEVIQCGAFTTQILQTYVYLDSCVKKDKLFF